MDEITRIAHRLQEADGVVAVALGGSGARGTHRPDSDVDLGLYYRAPLDTEALRRLAAELSGDTVEVTEPGGWGPWVNGGAWLTVEGTPSTGSTATWTTSAASGSSAGTDTSRRASSPATPTASPPTRTPVRWPSAASSPTPQVN